MKIPLIGLFRSGTNYTRTLLEFNYDIEVEYNMVGWKHGPIATFHSSSPYRYPEIGPLVVIKDPISTLLSWFAYINRAKRDMRSEANTFSSFLRSPIVYFDEATPGAPEYYFSNPMEMWNSIVWNHVVFAEKRGGCVVRYEDVLRDPEEECERIARHYDVHRKRNEFVNVQYRTKNMTDSRARFEDSERYTTSKVFDEDKKQYFLNREYLREIDASDLVFALTKLSKDLLAKYGYEIHDMVNVGEACLVRSSKPELFTMASDASVADLAIFLETVSRLDGYSVKVIPFDDSLVLTKRVCELYGAEIVAPLNVWDSLGKELCGDKESRKGTKSWRTLRKLNAVSYAKGDLLFVDVSCVMQMDIVSLMRAGVNFDVLFGARSLRGRNFSPFVRDMVNMVNPYVKEGFNAAFWYMKKGAITQGDVERIVRHQAVKRMVSKVPEQSLLNMVVSLKGCEVKLFEDVVEKSVCPFFVLGKRTEEKHRLDASGEIVTVNQRPICVARMGGRYHQAEGANPQRKLRQKLVASVMEKVTHDEELYRALGRLYRDSDGHDNGAGAAVGSQAMSGSREPAHGTAALNSLN